MRKLAIVGAVTAFMVLRFGVNEALTIQEAILSGN